MERVLALQNLSEAAYDDSALDSNFSLGCSDASSGPQGISTCSVGCKESEEMDW
jgi:hypothetical protein